MKETKLGVVEDTLYVPMLGRIYASEHCRNILYDKKALELKNLLPEGLAGNDTQTQYTYLASASRSANVDRYVKNFLERKPDGIIVQIGCGLETTWYRNDNGHTLWYGVDLPPVIAYRRELLPETGREKYIPGDAFAKDWIEEIRAEHPAEPVLVIASGLFYYFPEEDVQEAVRMLLNYGDVELLFDAVNKSGMMMMRKKHMKTVGHEDAKMFFFVDSAAEFAAKTDPRLTVLAEEMFYRRISKKGLKLSTKASMALSDLLGMVKMVHLGR